MTTTQNVSIIKEESDKIVTLCEQLNTALKAIHKIIAMNGAGELAWLVVNNRTLADKDIKSAMYLLKFLNKIDDLPFEGLSLIKMILEFGDDNDKKNMMNELPEAAKVQLQELKLI